MLARTAAIARAREQIWALGYMAARDCVGLVKAASIRTAWLSGKLYKSKSGWGLLFVPNALGIGAHDALHELGVSLPYKDSNGRYEAHISVFRGDELEDLERRGVKINEWGRSFDYRITGLIEIDTPGTNSSWGRVWAFSVESPDLKALRKSYGLDPLPKYPFHITIGVRKRGVLGPNEVSKAAAL